jgi:predicted RNA-binding Zn-ribbon protein involved in translation (DUF1610 family)
MFGIGVPEFTILLIILIIIAFALKIMKLGKSSSANRESQRKCLSCGYEGEMKTWLGNYNSPQLLSVVLLFVYVIPGLLFISWAWGKKKCPNCGALDKNAPLVVYKKVMDAKDDTRSCPFCAETIKSKAIVCRFCGKDIPKKL